MAITDLLPWKRGETVPVRHDQGAESPPSDLRQEMNRLFDEFLSPFGITSLSEWPEMMGQFLPHTDVVETDDEVIVSAELPGMDEKEVEILLHHDSLVIRGEKRSRTEERNRRYHRLERSFGSFCRTIPLPEAIDQDKVEATFKKGVLTVSLPKKVRGQERARRVAVKAA